MRLLLTIPPTRLTYGKKRRLRKALSLQRDNRCAYCSRALDLNTATRDHVRPKARGGTNQRSNLVWACETCNQLKGKRTLQQWRNWLAVCIESVDAMLSQEGGAA